MGRSYAQGCQVVGFYVVLGDFSSGYLKKTSLFEANKQN